MYPNIFLIPVCPITQVHTFVPPLPDYLGWDYRWRDTISGGLNAMNPRPEEAGDNYSSTVKPTVSYGVVTNTVKPRIIGPPKMRLI